MSLGTCFTIGCVGHLGKYDSCEVEALHAISLDPGSETTGDVEAHGHFTLIEIPEADRSYTFEPHSGGHTIEIEAGWWIVAGNSQGFVSADHYATEEEARKVFAEEEARYAEWLGEED